MDNVSVIRTIVRNNLEVFTIYNDLTKADRRLKFRMMNSFTVASAAKKLKKIKKELETANAIFTEISWLEYEGTDGNMYTYDLVIRVPLF